MTEGQISQSIDGGVPIQRLARQFSNIRAALDFYEAHLLTRFPQAPNTISLKWKITYYTKKNIFFSIMAGLGHFVHMSKVVELGAATQSEKFVITHHYIDPRELKRWRMRYATAQLFGVICQMIVCAAGGTAVVLAGLIIYDYGTHSDGIINPSFFHYFVITSIPAILSIIANKWLYLLPIPREARFLSASKCELVGFGTSGA